MYCNIVVWAIKSLLQESKKNRDNDGDLECLSEHNKENWDREDLDSLIDSS